MEQHLSRSTSLMHGALDDFPGFLVYDMQVLQCPFIIRIQEQVIPIRIDGADTAEFQFRSDDFELLRELLFKLGQGIFPLVTLPARNCK